jgi:hypothetical protein
LNTPEFIFKKAEEAGLKIPKGFPNPFGFKPLLLSISLKKVSSEELDRKIFKHIIEAFKNNFIKLMLPS